MYNLYCNFVSPNNCMKDSKEFFDYTNPTLRKKCFQISTCIFNYSIIIFKKWVNQINNVIIQPHLVDKSQKISHSKVNEIFDILFNYTLILNGIRSNFINALFYYAFEIIFYMLCINTNNYIAISIFQNCILNVLNLQSI